MHFSGLTATALGLLPLLAAASPLVAQPDSLVLRDVATGEVESFKNATLLGVDIFAPMPSDFTSLPNGLNKAEPGSKAFAWMRAQLDIDETTLSTPQKLARRQAANIRITGFTGQGCGGTAYWSDPTNYNQNIQSPGVTLFSFGIASRNMVSGEQLDFSRYSGSNPCGQFVTLKRGATVGCNGNIDGFSCWRLWRN
ncbi:hypothetical protein RB597_009391 [Gaeumannomyces tritici]